MTTTASPCFKVYVIRRRTEVVIELRKGPKSWLHNLCDFSSISLKLKAGALSGAITIFSSNLCYKEFSNPFPGFFTSATIRSFLSTLRQFFILLVMLLARIRIACREKRPCPLFWIYHPNPPSCSFLAS